MPVERRKGDRVSFERGVAVHMLGIDGNWQRDCKLEDVSETGAKLTIGQPFDNIDKEFFLLLSSTGLAYRRCELAWQNGGQIGVNFTRTDDRKKKTVRRTPAVADA